MGFMSFHGSNLTNHWHQKLIILLINLSTCRRKTTNILMELFRNNCFAWKLLRCFSFLGIRKISNCINKINKSDPVLKSIHSKIPVQVRLANFHVSSFIFRFQGIPMAIGGHFIEIFPVKIQEIRNLFTKINRKLVKYFYQSFYIVHEVNWKSWSNKLFWYFLFGSFATITISFNFLKLLHWKKHQKLI